MITLRRLAFAVCLASTTCPAHSGDTIRLQRVPEGGLQPQVAQDADGAVHLLYFTGEAAGGDLWYCRRGEGDSEFSRPLRVNSEPKAAIAVGTIRGGQLALGANGRVHVAWNGSQDGVPRGPDGETPLLYTRLDDSGEKFEPERNLIRKAYGLDGGCCIAADGAGKVYVAWHAGNRTGEANRRIWLVRSDDDGRTFSAEQAIDAERVGACGCCGMRGSVDPEGRVLFLYRAAREDVNRGMYLLSSGDWGETFASRPVQEWKITTCPMSSAAFIHSGKRSWAAWETGGQIYFAAVPADPDAELKPTAAAGTGEQRKHPALAVNAAGELLLAWTEGTGWNRGGHLAWQLYDREGRRLPAHGRKNGIPTWSFATPYAIQDGFAILY
jgi:hypothetical protein